MFQSNLVPAQSPCQYQQTQTLSISQIKQAPSTLQTNKKQLTVFHSEACLNVGDYNLSLG